MEEGEGIAGYGKSIAGGTRSVNRGRVVKRETLRVLESGRRVGGRRQSMS